MVVSPQHTKEIVDELDQDIVNLDDKLSAFLNLTRKRNDVFEPVDVAELIHEAVRLAEPVLAQHGLSVDTDVPVDLPQPKLQKAAMRDALLNVIINAGQSGQQDGAVRVAAHMQDNVIQFLVEDDGKGIPNKNLPRLFDPFFTTRDDGNGLGLAIVQKIVSLHQGHVYAENRQNGGARIVLSLPLQPKEYPLWWKKMKNNSPA